ncbi:MAG: hypothetical protein G01um101433_1051 [Parcubacteria group bacterium Gr01-1014_33]|nr:MAG: hypothetical protein G01um101433_1051 [Parcubacteria group bacterium Gr01-1014_33]
MERGEDDLHFQVQCPLGAMIRTTKAYWEIITRIKHPQIQGKEEAVKHTLRNPIFIRQSKSDPKIYLFYSRDKTHYLCVVARVLNGEGFIITAYITSKIVEGTLIWTKEQAKK